MKILHINCSDRGSTGKIISDISRYACGYGHKSFLCTPHITDDSEYVQKKKVCIKHEQGVYKRIASVLGLRYGFSPIPTIKILRYIKKIKPDLVHLHSINCSVVNIYKLMDFLKKKNFPTVVTNHSEFFYTGSCSHAYDCMKWTTGCGNCKDFKSQSDSRFFDRTSTAWEKMKKAFEGFERIKVVSVSPWTMERSKSSPIMKGIEQCTVFNGLNTQIFTLSDGKTVRQKLSITDDEKLMLCVTASFSPCSSDDVKGSKYIVEIAKRLAEHNVKIAVVGTHSAIPSDFPKNIILVGPVYDQKELARYYNAADLSIITSRRETFSMPVAESLCCGTPIVGFKAGGPESIAISEFSEFFEQGDVDGLSSAVLSKWLTKKSELKAENISLAAAEKYSSETMSKQYLAIYEEMIH